MVIDSHIHFWNYHPVKEAWITDQMALLRHDFLPEDVKSIFLNNSVEGCIAVQADQSEAETEFLLNLADNNNFIKGVVGWTDLLDANIADNINRYKQYTKLKGFRHIAEAEPAGFLTDKRVIKGIESIGGAGYVYEILIREHQMRDAIELSEKLPNQPLIIDHCAKPALRKNSIENWKSGIKELAKNKNMHCKLSGLLTEDNWHNHNEAQLKECLDIIFENFGTQRVLFGSDWPVMLLAGSYEKWITIIKNYIAQFSITCQQDILSGNATRFYNL